VLHIDGGRDHLLKRVAVQLAFIGMFNHSANLQEKIGRSMSVLEIPLAHAAFKRGRKLPSTEEAIHSCTSVKSVQETAGKVDKRWSDAHGEVQSLEGNIRYAVMKRLGMFSFLTNLIFCYAMLTYTLTNQCYVFSQESWHQLQIVITSKQTLYQWPQFYAVFLTLVFLFCHTQVMCMLQWQQESVDILIVREASLHLKVMTIKMWLCL
jgi:hypothetical protein